MTDHICVRQLRSNSNNQVPLAHSIKAKYVWSLARSPSPQYINWDSQDLGFGILKGTTLGNKVVVIRL